MGNEEYEMGSPEWLRDLIASGSKGNGENTVKVFSLSPQRTEEEKAIEKLEVILYGERLKIKKSIANLVQVVVGVLCICIPIVLTGATYKFVDWIFSGR
jgi:hypothetical protein